MAAKERTKENCRCFDAVRGCARGATVERSETGERTMIAPAGQSTARACLQSKLAALVVRRQADPRLGGCTPPRPPIRKSEGPMAKRTQYYCPFLTPSALPPLLSREFPRTPAGGRWRPPCQRGLAALADWGIPTGCAWPPIPGQPPHAKRGRAAALPRPSRPQLIHATL